MLSKPLRRVAAALMFIAVASPALADNVSGVYVGTYTASKLPGETLHIVLTFYQAGTSLRGHYTTSSGVAGDGWGVLSNSTAQMAWQNTTRSCPGTYQGTYHFAEPTVTWTYSGKDCLGDEKGKGQAKQVQHW